LDAAKLVAEMIEDRFQAISKMEDLNEQRLQDSPDGSLLMQDLATAA